MMTVTVSLIDTNGRPGRTRHLIRIIVGAKRWERLTLVSMQIHRIEQISVHLVNMDSQTQKWAMPRAPETPDKDKPQVFTSSCIRSRLRTSRWSTELQRAEYWQHQRPPLSRERMESQKYILDSW
ncbi:uncharacterized protein LOC134211212 [Armigeres subalbatus]|uniref:uncharacterized protein LOC134211212 n=1 Tax=Armigeres subalbatus TaxID=124917 RepID=UPI002ED5E1CB